MNADADRHHDPMTSAERRSAGALSGIVALRLFGLFLILPVFAALARDLPGATPVAVGLALGIYGLTQGLLQLPFGWLSDRLGRRPVIALGLVLFVAGSVLAALATHMAGIIAGRALQGCGAVAGVAMAMAADHTRVSQRSKIMALIGASVGGAFLLAMLAGPVLASWHGLPGLFWASAILGAAALALLYGPMPRAPAEAADAPGRWSRPTPAEASLCLGAFLLHGIITALFVALPLVLEIRTGWAVTDHWRLYLPALAIGGGATMLWIFRGRESRAAGRLAPAALAVGASALAFLADLPGWPWALTWITLFFAGFNLLEATLPAMMTRAAPASRRGSAMGLYTTGQFLGAFAGGLGGGFALQAFGPGGVFVLAGLTGLAWAMALAGARRRFALPTEAEPER